MAKKAKIVEYPVGHPEWARVVETCEPTEAQTKVGLSVQWLSYQLYRAVHIGKKVVYERRGCSPDRASPSLWPECQREP